MLLAVVGCGKAKGAKAAPARLLYTSRHFRTALTYADTVADFTVILSALHGVVECSQILAPYDFSWRMQRPSAEWVCATGMALRARTSPGDVLLFIVGKAYWKPLLPWLAGRHVRAPFEHMKLASRTAHLVRLLAEVHHE